MGLPLAQIPETQQKTPGRTRFTFDSQGADTAASPASKTVTNPATTIDVLPTEPVKAGYAFGGWYSKSGANEVMFSATTTVTKNLTVYAKWQIGHSISFDANGGEGTMQPFAIAQGGTANLPANAYTREGFTFVGWSFDKNGSILYADKAQATMGMVSLNFYACWNPTNASPASDFTYSKSGNQTSLSKYNGNTTDIVIPAYINGYPVVFHGVFVNNITIISVTIPETTSALDAYSFEKCTNLTTVNMPATITEIKTSAFEGCTKLTSVYIAATTPPTLGTNALPENAGLNIYVPASAVNAYTSATNWKSYSINAQQ